MRVKREMRRLIAQTAGLNDIEAEQRRIDDEFGVQVHDPVYWFAVLGKQVGQLGEKVIAHKWAANRERAASEMYHEAQQVAAVALLLMEAITLGELPDEITSAKPRDPRQRAKALGHGDEQLHYDPAFGRTIQDSELPKDGGE